MDLRVCLLDKDHMALQYYMYVQQCGAGKCCTCLKGHLHHLSQQDNAPQACIGTDVPVCVVATGVCA